MSPPVHKVRSRKRLPDEYARYFKADKEKFHRLQLFNGRGGTLFFDLTRDAMVNHVRVNGSCYFAHPAALIGLESGQFIYRGQLDIMIDSQGQKIEIIDCFHEDYLTIWSEYFAHFMESVSRNFDHVVLYKSFLTNKMIADNVETFGDANYVSQVNGLLASMYERAEQMGVREVVTVPTHLAYSSHSVPWGGPTHSHFIDEALLDVAEQLRWKLPVDQDLALANLVQRVTDRHRREYADQRELVALRRAFATFEVEIKALRGG